MNRRHVRSTIRRINRKIDRSFEDHVVDLSEKNEEYFRRQSS